VEGRQDEFRELADSLDAMLTRLEAHVAEQTVECALGVPAPAIADGLSASMNLRDAGFVLSGARLAR